MKFAPIEGKTQFTKSEMIACARRRGFQAATEAQFGHWVDYGLIGKGQQRGRKPALWSLPQMHLYLQLLEQNQRPGVHPIHLCTVTTWGWLYLGDETDIQIEQVERVMQTWQAMQLQHSSDGTEKRVARTVVEHIANKKQEGKRLLMNDIASFMKKLDYPTSKDDFFYHLETVIDPQGKHQHNGPQGAPLTAEALSWYYEINLKIIEVLSKKEALPRKYWTSARNLLLFARAQYQQEQPQFAQEVAGKPSAELFRQQTLNEFCTAACYDLRLMLGSLLARPELCERGEQIKAQSQIITSPLLLPNGTHYRYLHIEGHSSSTHPRQSGDF